MIKIRSSAGVSGKNVGSLEVILYYEEVYTDTTDEVASVPIAASQKGKSSIEDVPEYAGKGNDKVRITNKNYQQIIKDFPELEAPITKFIELSERIETWIDENYDLELAALSPKSLSRYFYFFEKKRFLRKSSGCYTFDCSLSTHQLKGQARNKANDTRERVRADLSQRDNVEYKLAEKVEIRVNKAVFTSYDEAFDAAVRDIQERVKNPNK
jgi:hypothetical protein